MRGRVKVLRGVSYLKQAIHEFKKILENPKLYLHTLTFWSWRGNPVSLEEYIEDVLKFVHLLHVQHLSFDILSTKALLNILPSLKPGYLTKITIKIYLDEATIGKLVEMDQWKQAKHFDMSYNPFNGPLRHLYHSHEFTVSCWNLSVEDAREMKEILLKSPDFKKCDLDVRSPIDPNLILQVFGGPIEGSIDTCHYPTPNSTEYFEIFVNYYGIKIEKKKK
ncbi:hypothetical protein CAEBREN_15358 [Caenorhabditis brenneri]|uniref:DUF38 domain-containing protein n=1 Tax=Caenorhabditis brenneri TaxID=135651 RepID=G0NIE3_CAEBE|nr:hypothetical protein CAEBREN_15358 [Caenorhabditis brenneri]